MNYKIKKTEIVIYIFFFIISFCKGIGLSNSDRIYFVMYFLGVVLAILKLFQIGFSRKEIIPFLFLTLIGILDYILGSETTILFTLITLLFLKSSNIKSIIKVMFYGRIISFLLMTILPLIGIIEMKTFEFYRSELGGFVTRYAFGYTHPNLAHSNLNIVIIMFVYLYFDKIKFGKIVILELINYIFFQYTNSRTGFIILSLFLLLTFFTKNSRKIQKLLPKILNISFISFIAISFIMALGYGRIGIFSKINNMLTGRLRYMSLLLNNYNIPIIKIQNYDNILFDNGYFDLLYNGGILAFLWFFFIQIKTNKYIEKNKLYKEALLTFIFFFYSITESYYVSSMMNISLLFLSYVLFNNPKINKEEEKREY